MVHVAYIGLGSNVGERAAHVRGALDALRADEHVLSVQCSSLRETEAVGGPAGQGRFINAAARVETTLAAAELLALLASIERRLGRVRGERWGPRTIDLDLLLFDSEMIDMPGLTVPHPRMQERRFVLEPLAEIAGEVRDPVTGHTVRELLAKLAT